MIDFKNILNKKTLVFIASGVAIFLLIGLFLFLVLQRRQTEPPTKGDQTPTPFPLSQVRREKAFNQQNSIPGITKESEISDLPSVIKSEKINNNSTRFDFPSINPFRPTEIITENGIVIFEKTVIPSDPDAQSRLNLDTINGELGEPDQIISGSADYGPFNNTYSYSSKGFVFIANPENGFVYEIHSFVPMSTEQYIQKFGGSIQSKSEERL